MLDKMNLLKLREGKHCNNGQFKLFDQFEISYIIGVNRSL